MNTKTVEFTHVTQVNFNQNDHNVEWVGQDKKFHFNFDEKNKQHQTICNWLHASRLYEADVSNFLRAVVKPGDYTVDVGANIGMHTLLMSTLVENTGKVVAFEPSLENVDELKENLTLNEISNVEVRQKVLGKTQGESVYFHFSTDDSGTSYALTEKDDAKIAWEEMKTVTLNSELANEKQIKVIKIDVEGFEGDVLRGASHLLFNGSVRYWIVEYAGHCWNRNKDDLNSVRRLMSEYGLDMFVLDGNGGFPKLYPPNVYIYSNIIPNLLFAKLEHLNEDWVLDDVSKLVVPYSPNFEQGS